MSQTYYFLAASTAFFASEPLEEVLEERTRHYASIDKPLDFAYVDRPAFLNAPELAAIRDRLEQPTAAIVSTDPQLIRWLKLRLEYVELGEFNAPSETIPAPMASLPE
jgi:hypothetical protein